MVGRVPQPQLRLIILCALTFVQCFAQEEYCNAEDEASCKKDTGKDVTFVYITTKELTRHHFTDHDLYGTFFRFKAQNITCS